MPASALIISANWVGDCIMSMPALEAFRTHHPDVRLDVLCRPHLEGLWELLPVVDTIHTVGSGAQELFQLRSRFGSNQYDRIFLFPNSVRSGIMAKIIGSPVRRGYKGHQRSWLLTEIVEDHGELSQKHQCWEGFRILDVPSTSSDEHLPCPVLNIPDSVMATTANDDVRWTGFIPCAARGPSKEWPEEYFVGLGKRMLETPDQGILLLGGPHDREKCERMAKTLGPRAKSLAGKTSMIEWAAWLRRCDLVVANDSGGMHLAAALGVPVVAIFGQTDPGRTGPLGGQARIIKESKVANRSITRDSQSAQESLKAISVERVEQEIHAGRLAENKES